MTVNLPNRMKGKIIFLFGNRMASRAKVAFEMINELRSILMGSIDWKRIPSPSLFSGVHHLQWSLKYVNASFTGMFDQLCQSFTTIRRRSGGATPGNVLSFKSILSLQCLLHPLLFACCDVMVTKLSHLPGTVSLNSFAGVKLCTFDPYVACLS